MFEQYKSVLKKLIQNIFGCVMRIFPINPHKIIFLNFRACGFGDNPKYLALELLNRNRNYDLVWIVKDRKDEFPVGIRTIKYGTIRCLYEQATAKVWIYNIRQFIRTPKRKGQFFVQTWHGPCAFKRIEGQLEENSISHNYLLAAKYDGKVTDLMLSNSRIQTQEFKNDFWYSGQVCEYGSPRNDVLFSPSSMVKEKVYEILEIRKDDFIILYAPTFRDNSDKNPYDIDFNKVIKECEKIKGQNVTILIRMHPNVTEMDSLFCYSKKIKNVTNYPDMQELLCVSDMLITDYSSSILDYAITEKPIVCYVNDLESYINNRGLNQLFYSLPYPLAKSQEELYRIIANYDKYSDYGAIKQFINDYGSYDNGNASRLVVDIIEKKLMEDI